ncbi:MAG: serine hydrolase [Candidatus Parcubacteria bacterium]|jgi:predicted alpha/beta hydrolase family esterase|nr:serine hydrolase [Candidatus Parcubacteria bacterium]
MKIQVFVIHGGHARNSYEEYLEHLKKKEVDLEYLRGKGRSWKLSLGEKLGAGYDVYNPQMPNKENARYIEWKIWFEKFIPYLEDGIILIGHSLGGIFLAKYLAENDFPRKIRATFLVATPYNTLTEHPRADFNILGTLEEFQEQGGQIYIYHSKDDEIVPFSNFERYRTELPKAQTRVFNTDGHFNGEELSEIVADIVSLSS